MFKYIILCSLIIVSLVASAKGNSRVRTSPLSGGQIYAGARLGVGVPLSLGRSSDDISFKDVSSVGFAAKGDVFWLVNSVVGVGGELGFNSFPYKEQFWASLNRRGSFNASYRDMSAGLTGRLFFGTYDVKPFFGIAANAHYLRNSLDFKSSYVGTSQDESVSYTSNQIKPGFALEAGIFYHIGSVTQLSVGMRLNVLPFLDEDKMTTVDPYSYVEQTIVVNPHGNQNNFEVVVGLHFLTTSSKNRVKH